MDIHNIPLRILFENLEDNKLTRIPRGTHSGASQAMTGTKAPMIIWNQSEDPDNMEDYTVKTPPTSKIGVGSGTHGPSNPLTLSKPNIKQGETPMA